MRPLHHDMHAVDVDALKNARVVRDDDERAVTGAAVCIDAARNDGKGVDVEARVGFVENGQLRLEQQQLQHFELLLFAAREANAQLAVEVGGVEVEFCAQFLGVLAELLALKVQAFAARGRCAQEARQRNAGNLDGRLEAQEHACMAALVGRKRSNVLAVEHDGASGHVVRGIAHYDMAKGGFAGAVRAHEHVGFALSDAQVDAVQNLPFVDRRGEAADAQQLSR